MILSPTLKAELSLASVTETPSSLILNPKTPPPRARVFVSFSFPEKSSKNLDEISIFSLIAGTVPSIFSKALARGVKNAPKQYIKHKTKANAFNFFALIKFLLKLAIDNFCFFVLCM